MTPVCFRCDIEMDPWEGTDGSTRGSAWGSRAKLRWGCSFWMCAQCNTKMALVDKGIEKHASIPHDGDYVFADHVGGT